MAAIKQYYVFETQQEALKAEMYISTIGNFPIINVDDKGVPQPNKQKTERWATPIQRLDGKWLFERVPIEIAHNYPQEVLENFSTKHNYTIETYSDEWFNNEIL